jgi:hypothetical protein
VYDPKKERFLFETLLEYILSYPFGGDQQERWAVKESQIIRGNLALARERPGYGVALVSVKFALKAVGEKARPQIQTCVGHISRLLERKPPYFVLTPDEESITSRVKLKRDLRHTIAFADILAYTDSNNSLLKNYIRLILRLRKPDGGWAPDEIEESSELMTVTYAVDFLSICLKKRHLLLIDKRMKEVRDGGIAWLMANADEESMWRYGAFESPWERPLATAWILYYLIDSTSGASNEWKRFLASGLSNTVRVTAEASTWVGTSPLQRFRVESRVAAAATISLRTLEVNSHDREIINDYLDLWRRYGETYLKSLDSDEWDLSTVIYLAESLVPCKELGFWGERALLSMRKRLSTVSAYTEGN